VKRWKQAQNMKRPTPERNTLHERHFTHRRRFTRKNSGSAIAAEAFMNHAGYISVVQILHRSHPTDLADQGATRFFL
jgi:hypothetical protein